MAFVEDFICTQDSPSTITLTDNSTGSDPNIINRTIEIFLQDNSLLSGKQYTWDIADSAFTLTDILDKDYAMSIRVIANSTVPDPQANYVKSNLFLAKEYNELYLDGLITEQEARYPRIVNDTTYREYKLLLREYIDDAVTAVTRMNDIYKAQTLLDAGTFLRRNPNLYF